MSATIVWQTRVLKIFVMHGFVRLAYEVLFSADIGQPLKSTSLFHILERGYLEEQIHPNRMGAVSYTPTGEG